MKKATPEEAANNNQPDNNKKVSFLIDDELRKRVAKVMPCLTKARSRLVLYLLFKGRKTTGSICHYCEIGNLSDTVIKIQPLLNKFGLEIRNYPPATNLTNSHGERTFVHYWELGVKDGKSER